MKIKTKWHKVSHGVKPKPHEYSNIQDHFRDYSESVLIYGTISCHNYGYAIATYYPLSEWNKQTGQWYCECSNSESHVARSNEVELWIKLDDI